MKYCYTILFLISGYLGLGQVSTPPFTNNTGCPSSYSQVYHCVGWRQPTGGTSDYFHACATSSLMDVPDNYFGNQQAVNPTDSTYTGIYTTIQQSLSDYKEYIATSFKPLTIGQTYTMTITVSLADKSTYANDGFGVFFSTYKVDRQSFYSTMPITPQVDYSSYGVITDKVNWVSLTKTFVADSAYTHLMVGCFKPTGVMIIDTVPSTFPSGYAYYYIGSIGMPDPDWEPADTTVPPVDTTTPPPVDTTSPPDSNVTIPDTVAYIFPNAFTPNADGRNDVFRIIGKMSNDYKDYVLRIFNRWGQCVFTTNDPATGWDGTFNNVPQELGAYFYHAGFTLKGRQVSEKGDLILIR